MAKVIRIVDYHFKKMHELISKEREEMTQRHEQRMKETQATLKKISDNRAKFQRRWFKFLKGGK